MWRCRGYGRAGGGFRRSPELFPSLTVHIMFNIFYDFWVNSDLLTPQFLSTMDVAQCCISGHFLMPQLHRQDKCSFLLENHDSTGNRRKFWNDAKPMTFITCLSEETRKERRSLPNIKNAAAASHPSALLKSTINRQETKQQNFL